MIIVLSINVIENEVVFGFLGVDGQGKSLGIVKVIYSKSL